MKKLLIGVFTVGLVVSFHAQDLRVKDNLLSAGIGIGGVYGYNVSYTRSLPGMYIFFDHGIKTDLKKGLITLGGFWGYKYLHYHYDYPFNNYYYAITWNTFMLGVRSTFQFKIDEPFHIFIALMLGPGYVFYHQSSNDPDYKPKKYNSVYLDYSFSLGGRYAFSDNVGLFFEVGYGISYLTVGASFKL